MGYCIAVAPGVLPNFDLDVMDLFLLQPTIDSLIASGRWCVEVNRLWDVAQSEAQFSAPHQVSTYGKWPFIEICKRFS